MNILFLTKEYNHTSLPNCGGTGTFIANISKELVAKNNKVCVFGLQKKHISLNDNGVIVEFQKNKLSRNFFFKQILSISKKTSLLSNLHVYLLELELKYLTNKMYLYIEKNKLHIDIIETHGFDGLALHLNNSIPYIIRCHGSFSIFHKYFGFEESKYKMLFEKRAFEKSENIITISKYSQKMNHELFGLQKSKLIYNGIDFDNIKPNNLVEIIPKSIFFFGNLSKEKGADVAIEVLKKLFEINKNVSLHFIGIETKYKNIITENFDFEFIKNNIYFYGFQDLQKSVELLSKASVVIFPSKGETFGLALCEVMLLNKVVVVSNIDSFNEILEHNKTGFIANSIDEYCHHIESVFNQKIDSNMIGNNARQSIISKFGNEKMIVETLKYYEEIIKKN